MTAALLPTTVSDAVAAIADDPTIDVVAGGTDVMVDVNAGRRSLRRVLGLRALDELRRWSAEGDELAIGATVTMQQLVAAPLAGHLPALADAARTVGSLQIRTMATIGGNLGTASPGGDLLPVLLALDADVVLRSRAGSRRLPVERFITGHRTIDRGTDELIHSIVVWRRPRSQAFAKVGPRSAMAIATASCALVLQDDGVVACALGAVGPTVIRARHAESWLAARVDVAVGPVSPALAAEFGTRVGAEARARDDHRASAAYRTRAVEVLATRLLGRVAAQEVAA